MIVGTLLSSFVPSVVIPNPAAEIALLRFYVLAANDESSVGSALSALTGRYTDVSKSLTIFDKSPNRASWELRTRILSDNVSSPTSMNFMFSGVIMMNAFLNYVWLQRHVANIFTSKAHSQ